jgi:glycosyltransferase involved in cell wall biosynthesis
LIERTDGGILITPDDSEALADGLESLLQDTDRRESHGQSGRRAVHAEFTDERMAREMLSVFEKALLARGTGFQPVLAT